MYFVSRWREESPFGKRVVTVPDATVVDWFRRGWRADEPAEWIEQELGGEAYGLDSVFDEARKRKLPEPRSVDELRVLLHKHLWVEGGAKSDHIRLGDHALRVRTDDDEVDLAYYFIDDEAAAAAPDRLAFLLYDTWPLPADTAGPAATFRPAAPVRTVELGPGGPESVFSVRLCWESPEADRNLDLLGATEFAGLSLPDLTARLRRAGAAETAEMPYDARMLRALVAPDDGLGPALQRYARLPDYGPSLADVEAVLASAALPPTESLVQVDTHLAQAARYIDDFFGFDQWFLFDSRWAAAHPDLAQSLLHYAAHWDPYET